MARGAFGNVKNLQVWSNSLPTWHHHGLELIPEFGVPDSRR